MVHIEKKWIEAEQATFAESVNEKTGKKEFILTTKIFPYDKKSRNGVKYNKESALATKDNIKGITLNHNHVTSGENNFPRGEWFESYDGGDGLYGRAKVYDTSYNKDYIEWLSTAENIRVSLQVSGDAESIKGEDGKWHREAKINDWLEISTVNLPGFIDAKANFEKVMCEMVKLEEGITTVPEAKQAWDKVDEAINNVFKYHLKSETRLDFDRLYNDFKRKAWKFVDIAIKESINAGDNMEENKLRESHLSVGDTTDLAGVKVKVVEVTDKGYVVEDIEELNNEPTLEVTQSESFYTELNKINDKYITKEGYIQDWSRHLDYIDKAYTKEDTYKGNSGKFYVRIELKQGGSNGVGSFYYNEDENPGSKADAKKFCDAYAKAINDAKNVIR